MALSKEDRRSALVTALNRFTPEMKALLRQRKAKGYRLRMREDLVWYLLLQSFATIGNSRAWAGLFETNSIACNTVSPIIFWLLSRVA